MNLDFILLADAAHSADGKLFIHGGGLRRLDVPAVPWLARVSIAARFTAGLDEAGNRHELMVRLDDPGGDEVFVAPPLELRIPRREDLPPDWDDIGLQLVFETTVGFVVTGWYRFEVTLNRSLLAELPLRVQTIPNGEGSSNGDAAPS